MNERPTDRLPAGLVIDTGVLAGHHAPDLEDYVASYGGAALVDQLREAFGPAGRAAAEPAFAPRAVSWARFATTRLDDHAERLPRLLCERQAERGTHHSILLPETLAAPFFLRDGGKRQTLQRALNHYHADLWRRQRATVTPAAGVSLLSPAEGISQLHFAVKRLGYKVIWVAGHGDGGALDYDPFWEQVVELGVPVLAGSWRPGGRADDDGPSELGGTTLSKALLAGGITSRFPALRVALLGGPIPRRARSSWFDNLYFGSAWPLTGSAGTARPRLLYASEQDAGVGRGTADPAAPDARQARDALTLENPDRFYRGAAPHFFAGTALASLVGAPAAVAAA